MRQCVDEGARVVCVLDVERDRGRRPGRRSGGVAWTRVWGPRRPGGVGRVVDGEGEVGGGEVAGHGEG